MARRSLARRQLAWRSAAVQLLLGLLIAGILPFLVRAATRPVNEPLWLLNETLVACVIAIVIGAWLNRNLTTHPGVENSFHILPSFAMSYGLVLTGVVLLRFDYNRAVLFSSLILIVMWFYALHFTTERRRKLRVGGVPYGNVEALALAPRVRFRMLESPDASVADLDAVAADFRCDLSPAWERRLTDLALSGVQVFHTKALLESLTGRVELEHLSENSLASFAPRSTYMAFKHALDWFFALVAGVVLLPFLVAIALVIRFDSPGPAIFRQARVGSRARLFTVYKFRTMRMPDADQARTHHDDVTQSDDARVTSFGRLLRISRLDELPQILNILLGQMSWIGPRPEAERLSTWYETEIPFYRYRHLVRPGITGWAQVNQGHVADVDQVTTKLHYDFYYINNLSPWLDLLIVARTARTMLTGFGAR